MDFGFAVEVEVVLGEEEEEGDTVGVVKDPTVPLTQKPLPPAWIPLTTRVHELVMLRISSAT